MNDLMELSRNVNEIFSYFGGPFGVVCFVVAGAVLALVIGVTLVFKKG